MASRFCSITRAEIDQFLTGLGFRPIKPKGVVELVYGKIVRVGDHSLSLRIYTAVNPDGGSRARGTDAIRVQLFLKVQQGGKEEIVPVGRPQKCLRVVSWRENVRRAIQRLANPEHFRLCPACGHPMVLRENRDTGDEFWGCTMFRLSGCRGKRPNACGRRTPVISA